MLSAKAIFPRVRLTGFAFDVEVLLIAQRLGLRMIELPVTYRYNGEISSVRILQNGSQALIDLVRIYRWDRQGVYPPRAAGGQPVHRRLVLVAQRRPGGHGWHRSQRPGILQHLGPGVTEIMVHPGYPEHLSDAWPQSHRYKRHGELTALTSPRVKNLIKTVGIKLMSYRDVQHNC